MNKPHGKVAKEMLEDHIFALRQDVKALERKLNEAHAFIKGLGQWEQFTKEVS